MLSIRNGHFLTLVLLCLCGSLETYSQTLYNPQLLYDQAGGLFEKTLLRDLYVEFDDPNYHEVLRTSFFDNPSYRIPAIVTLDGLAHDSVGVRYKGNSTFCLPNDQDNPKVPFNLDMNYWISGQKLMDYKKVKLANAWTDATYAREYLAAKIYRNYLPTPEINLMKLHVQGNYLGLYSNTESVNKQFAQKHFGENDGVLFKCDPIQVFCGPDQGTGDSSLSWLGEDSTLYYNSYDLKSNNGWEELLDLIYTLNFDFDNIEDHLNVDRVLWAFAVNTAISNYDTYNGYFVHNYYLYQTPDGQFQMIPWDLTESFVGALMGWQIFDPLPVYQFDPFPTPPERPLLDKLLNDERYRKQYSAHLRTILTEAFDLDAVESEIDEIQALCYDAASEDMYSPFTMEEFDILVDSAYFDGDAFWGYGGILSTLEERGAYLMQHEEVTLMAPSIGDLTIQGPLITVQCDGGSQIDLMATMSDYNSHFEAFPMSDDGLNGDAQANDGTYTAELPYNQVGNVIKFYVRAQNDNAMALLPVRAEYEFYEYDFSTSIGEVTLHTTRKLIKTVDALGRETSFDTPGIVFQLFDDGTVEKKWTSNLR